MTIRASVCLFLLMVPLAVVLTWHRNPAPVSPETPDHAQDAPAGVSAGTPAPAAQRLPGQTKVAVETSWDSYLHGISRQDRVYLEAVSARYFGTLNYRNAAERAELARLGTPLPAAWLAARQVSDADLRAMADAREEHAGIFLVDRLLVRMATVTDQAGASTYLEVVNAVPEAERPALDGIRREVMDRSASQLIFYPTPFSAYQYGLGLAAGTGTSAAIPAGMKVAGEMGDARAAGLLAAYSAEHPDENPQLVESAVRAMRALAGPSDKTK